MCMYPTSPLWVDCPCCLTPAIYLLLFQEDGTDRLVYKVGYFVDRVNRIPPSAINNLPGNVGLPAYMRGLHTHVITDHLTQISYIIAFHIHVYEML